MASYKTETTFNTEKEGESINFLAMKNLCIPKKSH